ncbi:MAG TPA: hypothetical protein VD973_29425 [Symbiobacteriaceae bacterium]|nr:hypothetical protein [Symbiobacteriaceae bacterium]
MNTVRKVSRRALAFALTISTTLLLAHGTSLAADGELDTAIASGFGKLVKYGRWGAALILAVVFCLAWAERGQNSDNPHEVNRGTKKMVWAGAGFVAVIGYKLILSGLVAWFNVNPDSIPAFLWQ